MTMAMTMAQNPGCVRGIDMNADVGESFGAWTLGADDELFHYISSANIACGWHAGDPAVMERTVALALQAGIALGAHPGYPDLEGFGRRSMALSPDEVRRAVLYQVGALDAFVRAAGGRLRHVKAHGALYNDAARSPALASALARAVLAFDPALMLVGLPGSELERAAAQAGLAFAGEFFADRGYRDDGSLVPRSEPGAMIHDTALCIERVLRAVRELSVVSVSGRVVPLRASTICLHGDNPEAVAFAAALRAALRESGIAIAPPGTATSGHDGEASLARVGTSLPSGSGSSSFPSPCIGS